MASTSRGKKYVVLQLKNPPDIEPESTEKEMSLSTDDIPDWDLSLLLSSNSIKVRADRDRLIEQSSYFRGLLKGGFRETDQDSVSIQFNLEAVIHILRFINGCPLSVTDDNFIPLMEGALFCGVEALLLECKAWFCELMTAKDISIKKIPLNAIVGIWNFGLEHEISFFSEPCARYIAQNFMWAISCESFGDVPYNLLCNCLDDPCLTVDSEKDLAEALLRWLDSNERLLECSSFTNKSDYRNILTKVRIGLLPLWFSAGKKRSRHFSKLADKSIEIILRITRDPYTSLKCLLGDSGFASKMIRLTEYTERIDLSGCPQITSAFLILSVLPRLCNMDPISRKKIECTLVESEHFGPDIRSVRLISIPRLLFQAVCEVNFSNCPRLHLKTAITSFCTSFPSLRTVKASYCPNFKMKTLFDLIISCPLVEAVDISTDISPAIPMQVSIISTNVDVHLDLEVGNMLKEKSLTSHITKLTLAGRSDMEDSDLLIISVLSSSLTYLNLKGCTSITDAGISALIRRCVNLLSLIVSDTYFGRNSIQALHERKNSYLLASRLEKLHIGGCASVDAASLSQLMLHLCMLRSLCLRGTKLTDDALYNFSGSLLERLDVSETMVSGAALTYIIKRNSGLKCFKSIGCRTLCCVEDTSEGTPLSYGSFKGDQLFAEIGRVWSLEDMAFGWGFSSFLLRDLGSAISSLRAIRVGLGASLNQDALVQLSKTCPLLESVVLKFQVISDSIVEDIVQSLRHLKVLELCYCLGELSYLSIYKCRINLRKLRLERVTPWMDNDDLDVLTKRCPSLTELRLSGCPLLNLDSQEIISKGWPSLISLHLEDCGYVTSLGVPFIFYCKAVEDLSLRHNGSGIPRSFIVDAASKMPMLRKVALDLCDACEGGFDTPALAEKFFLSTVTIARCKAQNCAFDFGKPGDSSRSVHKDNIVLEWTSKWLRTTIVKERL